MRLSLRKGAYCSPAQPTSTGNPGERSGEISVLMPLLGNVCRRSEADLSRRAVEGSAVPRTSPGNAEYDAQREFSSPATNMGGRVEPFGWVGERVRGQNPLIVRTGAGERIILFEHRIRGFQLWSAELQIPRLPRISCRELRLRSTACGSLY